MFAFFDAVTSLISIVGNFIGNSFLLLFSLVGSIFRAVTWLFLCISYLPGWLTGFVFVPVALSVIFQVINKGD